MSSFLQRLEFSNIWSKSLAWPEPLALGVCVCVCWGGGGGGGIRLAPSEMVDKSIGSLSHSFSLRIMDGYDPEIREPSLPAKY